MTMKEIFNRAKKGSLDIEVIQSIMTVATSDTRMALLKESEKGKIRDLYDDVAHTGQP